MRRAGAGLAPVFAQQSAREMQRTGRTPQDVIDAARAGIAGNWNAPSGADADHLKTREQVDATAAAGFTFFTIDPSEYVDQFADDDDELTLRERFASIRQSLPWYEKYLNLRIALPQERSFTIDEQAAMRCAVKYGQALQYAIALGKHIQTLNQAARHPFEIELSIDETRQQTSLAEHYIIADQFRQEGIELISVAPKLPGDFEKGIEYQGDIGLLEHSLVGHALIARELGPYKISLHSGSDKLSLYPVLAAATNGCFHIKTAGTSYLEALRVAVQHDESLFRHIVERARRHYDHDKATYHVTANIERLPPPDKEVSIRDLEAAYLGCWSHVPDGLGFTQVGRQVLHCTFGTILTDANLGQRLHKLLQEHVVTYTELLALHFENHLTALRSAM